jgi:hemerythrin-like metal-binding protein
LGQNIPDLTNGCANNRITGVRMALMAWGTYLETGHPELDGQHQRLVELINQLYLARTREETIRNGLLETFLDSVEAHFRWEEELMERLRCPELAEHRASHDFKRRDLAQLTGLYRNGGPDALGDWMERMHDWFLAQILQEDRGLAAFLLAQGSETTRLA